jgi:hypothetical protein
MVGNGQHFLQQTNGAPLRSGLRHIAAEHYGSASASLLAGAPADDRRQRHHLPHVAALINKQHSGIFPGLFYLLKRTAFRRPKSAELSWKHVVLGSREYDE